jgi:HEAT repeat protein
MDSKTVGRFFRGEAVDRDSAIAITNALNLEITEVVDPKQWNPAEQTADAIDWHEVCGKVLARQREEQRLRRQATERGFELNVYVPLGLVERKQQQRRCGDVPLEEVYQLTQEVITKEYDNDKFLTEVIEPGKSRRIAIIGEPGAGKTTLQEKIAVWIQENNKGLPICIPLGGLQGKSLEDYLLQIWLKAALRFIESDASEVEAQAFASLKKQFREGKVWLLLDGVDEMAATSPVEALATIKEQLTDGLVEARVVLTCRLNVWDANVKNLLTGFETYRTLEFKPEQVEDFIRQWFACAEKSQQYCSDKTNLTPPAPLPYQGMGEPDSPLLAAGALVRKGQGERSTFVSESQRGEELLRKLQEPGKERIRELVRNPLRLSLLCQTSYVLPVDEPLPETKAALYERFTPYFYEWKQEQHPTTRTERRQLNQALGELAKAGINSKVRFRLGEDFACDVMGEPLFDLACRLGWLNLVDREVTSDEAVYAFFHPTFQEYFAACVIEGWHFFLNHVPDNPMQGTYRIFEPQWKEVILLWLGRGDVKEEHKEAFINALMEFEDRCGNFYRYKAYFLAAMGIVELEKCSLGDKVAAQLVQWGFCDSHLMQEEARAALQETNRTKAVAALVKLIQNSEAEYICRQAAESLGKIDIGNFIAIDSLVNLILNSQNKYMRWLALESLREIGKDNIIAIVALIELIKDSQNKNTYDKSTYSEALSSLGIIGKGNSIAIASLIEFIRSCPDEFLCKRAIGTLGNIGKGNPTAINFIVDLIQNCQDKESPSLEVSILGEIAIDHPIAVALLMKLIQNSPDKNTRKQAIDSLAQIGESNPNTVAALVKLIANSQDEDTRREVAISLWRIQGNRTVVTALIELLQNSQDENTLEAAAWSLGKIDQGNPIAIDTLVKLIQNDHNKDTCKAAAWSLWQIAQGNTTAITALVELIHNSHDEGIRRVVAESLGKIGQSNIKVIDFEVVDALVELIQSSKDKLTCTVAVNSLGKIGKGNPKAVAALQELIHTSQDRLTCENAAFNLAKIDKGSPTAVEALVKLIRNSLNEFFNSRLVVDALKDILAEEQMTGVVTALKDYLSAQSRKNDNKRFHACYKVIWHCAQNMPYPDFYQAWQLDNHS